MKTSLSLLAASIMILLPVASALDDALVRDAPALLGAAPSDDEDPPAPRVVGERWIVGVHEMPDEGADAWAGHRILDRSDTLRFVTVDVTDEEEFRARVDADPNVAYYEPDGVMRISYTPNDPFWQQSDYTWGQWEIYADVAWGKTRGSTSAKLCVIDTGLYKGHEEFYGYSRIKQGYDFVYEDSTPNDPNGHGTHVTGIASAQIDNGKGMPGMARVTVIPIRVLKADGTGTHTDIAQGIDYCRQQGGHIASMSLGGGGSTTIQNAVVSYQNAGGLAIAAVGNDGCSSCAVYPAAYSGVLGVAAVNKDLTRASFSNRGSMVDITAPGVKIVSTYKNINGCSTGKCYVYLDGTSMATPFVSGVAALMKSYNSGLSAGTIQSRLKNTAQDLGASGWDSSYGYGLVRADRAVY